MRKSILIVILLLTSILARTQTDFEIAKLLIGKNISTVDTVLQNFGLEYYNTFHDKNELEFYLVKNNSVRVWNLKYRNIYNYKDSKHTIKNDIIGKQIIYQVYVRYRHDNINDLREFFAYEIPESTKYITYEKTLGKNVSDLKIVNVRYRDY